MQFRVLGPLAVEAAGGPVRLGSRLRLLLAALLVESGQVVPATRLVELLWDRPTPEAALVTLRSHIHHLRRALESAGPGGLESQALVTAERGYRLSISPEQIDAVQFRHLTRSGRKALAADDPATAVELLRAALALWRGRVALQDMADRPFVIPYAEDLAAVRRAASEARIEAELALGHHAELIGELRGLAEHSFDEVPWTQLALALYRSHWLDAAAQACREGLERLSSRSLDAPGLQELQSAILRRDPTLDWLPPRKSVPPTGHYRVGTRTGLRPRQLPPPPPHFTGRTQELASLDRILPPQAGGTVVVAGMPGVGKTALALHWLHDRSASFGGGHLYADLRGHGAGDPATPAEVLGQFLRALGVPPEHIPDPLDERAGLYRSLTAVQPALVLLDDASSAAQVRPLLPGSTESVLTVTSRYRLAGLLAGGARLLPLGPLPAEASAQMLRRLAGEERLSTEPAAAEALARLCGGLPLALCVTAARVASRPQAQVASVAEELSGGHQLLQALSAEDISVQAAFDRSYQALPADAARLYRQVGLLPAADFDRPAVAVAAGMPADEAGRLLGGLLDANLLDDTAQGRYGFHPLVRLHAQLQAAATDTPAEQEMAVRRVVDWYLACADAADRAVMPHRHRQLRAYAFPPQRPLSFTGPTDALAWLETERATLLAVVRLAAGKRWHAAAWQIVDAMWSLFLYRKHYQEWVASHRLGVDAARACADVAGETMLLNHLGLAFHGLGQFEDALGCFEAALVRHRAAEDRRGEATALNSSGLALHGLGRLGEATGCFTRAAATQRELGEHRGEALTRANLGRAHGEAGHITQACRHLAYARSAFATLADPYNEARALCSLGGLYTHTGRSDLAVRRLEPALEVMRALGSRFEEAQALEAVGDAVRLAGDESASRRHYEQALALYTDLDDPRTGTLQRRLGCRPGATRG